MAPAGAVLLFHRPSTVDNLKRDPLGTVMTTLIHLTTRSRWNHAALSLGDGDMVEATSAGVSVNRIASSRDEIVTIPLDYEGDDLEDVLAWATARVGVRYGYLNAFWCGLRNVFPGAVHIKHGDSLICSELVAEALERAGHDFQKDSSLVSPGDLATYFGVPR